MYFESRADSSLRSATMAVAYTTLFNETNIPEMNVNALRSYAATLASLKLDFTSTSETVKDETLNAVMLLSLLEVRLSGPFLGCHQAA
jgi:hypothetical protein